MPPHEIEAKGYRKKSALKDDFMIVVLTDVVKAKGRTFRNAENFSFVCDDN